MYFLFIYFLCTIAIIFSFVTGVSSLPMSVESLVMASFQCIDDPECMHCNICRLSFYNVSNKQAYFCGRPHTIGLITQSKA